MNTVGWLLLLAGALLVRQVATGRSANIREDFRDFFVALVRGDSAAIQQIGTRRGVSLPTIAPASTPESAAVSGGTPSGGSRQGGSVLAEMKRLAAQANYRYVFGATGPGSYDCSGLVWRAMKNLSIYTGVRFTTSTYRLVFPKIATQVSSPQVGDICIWPTHHMGCVSGPDRMFSAENSRVGIREDSIASFRPEPPEYWRLNG